MKSSRIVLVLFLLVVAYFVSASFLGPNPPMYLWHSLQAALTKDEILEQKECAAYTVQVRHFDYAKEGGLIALGSPLEQPSRKHVFALEAYKDDQKLFSTGDFPVMKKVGETNGYIEWHAASIEPHIPRTSIVAAFVVDERGFATMDSGGQHPGVGSVLFATDSGLNKEDVEAVARCYTSHASLFDEVLQVPVSSFVMLNNERGLYTRYEEFACNSSKTVAVDSAYLRVKGDKEGYIGSIGITGRFSSKVDAGDNDIQNSIPPNQRTISPWASCRTESGQTLSNYISELEKKEIIVSPST